MPPRSPEAKARQREYVKGNVQVISHRADILKRDGTAEELMKIALWLAGETARVRAETSAQ